MQAYMVGPSGVLRKALFSRGVPARLVAVRGLLYMIVQQLRTMDEGGGDDTVEADPELSLSQVLQLRTQSTRKYQWRIIEYDANDQVALKADINTWCWPAAIPAAPTIV